MIIYTENSEDSAKKLFVLFNKFSKVGGYKVNIKKSVAFPCTNKKLSEKENDSIYNSIKTKKKLKTFGIKNRHRGAPGGLSQLSAQLQLRS